MAAHLAWTGATFLETNHRQNIIHFISHLQQFPHAALPEGPVAGRAKPVLLGGANNLAVHAKSGGDALSRPAPRRETRLTGNSSLALM